MIVAATDLGDGEQPASQVLIVGAGAVGLTMAVDLARRGTRVTVLEAGPRQVDKDSQRYFETARAAGRPLGGLHLGRFRALGGTTNLWGGQLQRFDPIVFEKRAWAGDTGWPIGRSELDPFYDRTLELLGMKTGVLDSDVMRRLAVSPPPAPPELLFFYTRWAPIPNFVECFDKELRTLSHLRIVTGAPVVGLIADAGGAEVTAVETLDSRGCRRRFAADQIVLANGTIEIARLLMLPFTDGRCTPWGRNPWVGCGFMEHLDCVVGDVQPIRRRAFHDLFDNVLLDGIKYQPKLKLSEDLQRREELMGVACHFIFNSSLSEHLTAAKIFFKALLRGRLIGSVTALPRQARTLLGIGLPMLMRYLRYRRIQSWSDRGIQLRVTSEQLMVGDSRLVLKSEKDDLGMPLVELDWRVDGREIGTIAHIARSVRDYLKSSQLADVVLDQRLEQQDPSFLRTLDDGYHHMGMARMADDPARGVVDRDLRVHGSMRLFVAGAATYPSTGFANPTFTAIALGLRLAAKLADQSCP